MARAFSPKVVTANALLEGDVIYLDASGAWVRSHDLAELITDEAVAAERLALAAQDNQIVGAVLADAQAGESGPEPVHFREVFRAKGPANYAHGKQVESADV